MQGFLRAGEFMLRRHLSGCQVLQGALWGLAVELGARLNSVQIETLSSRGEEQNVETVACKSGPPVAVPPLG